MKYYCVFDTNIIIAFFIGKNKNSSISKLMIDNFLKKDNIIPVLNKDILNEYYKVLGRKKFDNSINRKSALSFLDYINSKSISIEEPSDYIKLLDDSVKNGLKDKNDFVFYNVVMEFKEQKEDAYLITGNLKDFPNKPFIISAHDMIDIIEDNEYYEKLHKMYYDEICKNYSFAKENMDKMLEGKSLQKKICILGMEISKFIKDFDLEEVKKNTDKPLLP